jgi:peptidyl-prolyl cis-trans isomerase A (cyclophilin A)
MPGRLPALFAICCLLAQPALAQTRVVIETAFGNIEVQLEPGRAPITVANFLRYVDGKLYDGGRFHRAVRLDNQTRQDVRIEVIQGGRSPENAKQTRGFGPIALERTSLTQLKHVDGAISMARGNAADSAQSDFFICVNDQPSLDEGGARSADRQGFAAFGRVVSGMDVVRKIQASPADKGERLTPPVGIIRVYRK